MLFGLYFLINAIEAFLLALFMVSVGSSAQESIILNLSPIRLVLVSTILLIGMGFLYLAARSLAGWKKLRAREEKFLSKEYGLWVTFWISIGLIFTGLFLLTHPLSLSEAINLIFQHMEPILVWITVFGAQTAFFSACWYCVYFLGKETRRNIQESQKELFPLFALFAGFVILKMLFITSTSYGPVGAGGEMTYFEIADSLYHRIFSPRDFDFYQYPPLYPLSLVITLVFKGWSFEGIKLLNNLFSSSIIFPIYFISRKFLDARKSLIAVFLSCLIPFHLVFPRRILSENLYFPLFLWAMLVTFAIPEKRKFRLAWDILNGILIGVLYLTRYITLAAIPFFMLSWWVKKFEGETSLFKPGKRKIIHFSLLCAAIFATFCPWLLLGIKKGVEIKLMFGFGIASITTAEQLTLPKLAVWIILYICFLILLSAPVLPLLITSIKGIDIKNLQDGFDRWVFQVLAIMAGFFAAATRHSWRAIYNREIPTVIMGRYLIIFAVLFFIIALVTLDKLEPTGIRTRWKYFTGVLSLSGGLIAIAYFILIKGAIIPTDGNLLRMQGSLDGFFTEISSPFFFIILILIYGFIGWLLWKGKRQTAVIALAVGVLAYYAAGIPIYLNSINDNQTYPWLAKQISDLLPPPDLNGNKSGKISVFLPPESKAQSIMEIYGGLQTQGIDGPLVAEYSPEALAQMSTQNGFIIEKLNGIRPLNGLPVYEFNNEQFQIIPIQK